MSNHVLSLLLATSTTSVSPSHRPRESPIHDFDIGGMRAAVGVDQAIVQRPLERHGDGLGRLEDLKRKIQIHDPRDAGHVALPERIGLLPILKVLRLLRGGPRLIRDLAAGHNRPAGQHVVSRGVILKIGCRGAGRLPDALEVRLAVGRARQRLRRIRRRHECAAQNDRGNRYLCRMVRLHVTPHPRNEMAPRLLKSAREDVMKYLFAWILGVPGGLILLWFAFNHMH